MNDDGEPDDRKGHVRFEVTGAGIRLCPADVGVRKPSSEMDRAEGLLPGTKHCASLRPYMKFGL
jgi:hypothetical protein